ncbi:TonB family protein [Flammeovirga sp. MY04]|uniref:energy transducer TonB n=1 Tax=Flammeovirga sp. MY04 TaxID=1191459 RepID=UPI000824C249|nr:energy transducer TonB [Flammeovirga sp. MY04]ANQ49455.2 TonB family protein [Flammeovirga sp. MY04]
MISILGKLGIIPVIIILVVSFLVLIQLFRFIMNKVGTDIIAGKKTGEEKRILVKKYNDVDISKYSWLFGMIGISFSMLVVLVALEFPSYEEQQLMDLGSLDFEDEEMVDIPVTQQQPPPPPKVTVPQIVQVPDEEEIEDEIEIDLPEEFDDEAVIEEAPEAEEVEEEEEAVEEIFEIVEDPAGFPGGMGKFYKWVGKNMKYPSQAKRMGVEGKVYVQFVVDKDGTLTDIKVVRGIGAGCDEAAINVLKKAPKWKPGKQRGRPVKQRMVLPISFKLG